MSKTHAIVILSDGENWSTLSGCTILVIDDKQFDDLCNDRILVKDLKPVAEIGLENPDEGDDLDPPRGGQWVDDGSDDDDDDETPDRSWDFNIT